MAMVGSSSGTINAIGDVTVVGTAGVAALDTPQLTQTKIEIRTLVAEIAELSTADIDCETFLQGMLPRICTAMGATAAAVWGLDCQQGLTLTASHNLPAAIDQTQSLPTDAVRADDVTVAGDRADMSHVDRAQADAAHQRILGCVAAEGGPILVPPRSIRVAADRPINPLDEALLIVPIRIHDRVDTLLEVIQPGCGGPAAQRGYLRFVAQMADLLADFLRRSRLRDLNANAGYVNRLQEHLLAVNSEHKPAERSQLIAKALAGLLQADLVLLLTKSGRRWRVKAISNLATFDPRSEIVVAAQDVMLAREPSLDNAPSAVELVARVLSPFGTDRNANESVAERAANANDNSPHTNSEQTPAEQLCRMLGSESLYRVTLNAPRHYHAIVAQPATTDPAYLKGRAAELAQAFGSLLGSDSSTPWWLRRASSAGVNTQLLGDPKNSSTLRSRLERVVVRASTVLLVLAIALFPTPDQLGVIAVLEAVDKEQYYAPVSASVEKVLVDSDQQVRRGQPLITLTDPQLEASLDDLTGKRLTCATQLEQDRSALLRGQQLTPSQRDDLESHIEQLKINLHSLDEQLVIIRAQAEQLKILARHDALVTTWDARNRLQGRPVAAGQLLLTTCATDANWRLQLSIPEREAGRIEQALEAAASGLPVQFSLSSHPSEVRTGRLVSISKQLMKDDKGSSTVIGQVALDASSLPAKTDGAVARAAIDCGRSVAVWLIVRDAYTAAGAWLRLTW